MTKLISGSSFPQVSFSKKEEERNIFHPFLGNISVTYLNPNLVNSLSALTYTILGLIHNITSWCLNK